MRYKLETGSTAWIIHRITGTILTFYIFAHLYVLSNIYNPERFTQIMDLMKNPLVKLGEIGLLGVVLAHSLNGARLTLIDLGAPTKSQKPLFYAALAIGGVLFIFGAVPFLGGGH